MAVLFLLLALSLRCDLVIGFIAGKEPDAIRQFHDCQPRRRRLGVVIRCWRIKSRKRRREDLPDHSDGAGRGCRHRGGLEDSLLAAQGTGTGGCGQLDIPRLLHGQSGR